MTNPYTPLGESSDTSDVQPRGYLIVVEGLDRSGKTTQCQRLCENIRAHTGSEVEYIKFPDRMTATGQMIDAYLRGTAEQNDQAIHLLFSANRWEAVQGILDLLDSGTTIVIDRYSFSGAVYSAAKDNPALGLEWAWNPEIGLPKPDLVVFLDISEENAARRGGYGEERYEKEEMQRKVRMLFKELFGRLNAATDGRGGGVNVHIVDAGGTSDEVTEKVWQAFLGLRQGEQEDSLQKRELQTLPAL